MSRITRDRIEPGDPLSSAGLDTRYSDYTQTDLNLDNVADGSVDSQHMPLQAILKGIHQQALGTGDIQHSSVQSVARKLSGATAATVLAPAGGFPLNAAFGFDLATNDVLRVYITYQCRGMLDGLNPHTVAMGLLQFTQRGGAAATQCNLGAMAWMFQLQWDITSSSLAAWASLPNQDDMSTTWKATGLYGAGVDELAGTAFIPAWWSGGMFWGSGDHNNGDFGYQNTGWRAVTLSWVYKNTGPPKTVYGLRTVAHGLFHPYNDGSDNGVVLDTTAYTAPTPTSPYLEVGVGNAVVMHMRGD